MSGGGTSGMIGGASIGGILSIVLQVLFVFVALTLFIIFLILPVIMGKIKKETDKLGKNSSGLGKTIMIIALWFLAASALIGFLQLWM